MAEYNRIEAITAQAAVDLSGRQYHVLRRSAAGIVNVASNPGGGAQEVAGVLLNKPTSGRNASVAVEGFTKVVAGGAVTANRMVTANGSGRIAHAVSGDWILGMALEAAGADGEIIQVHIGLPARHVPSSLAAL